MSLFCFWLSSLDVNGKMTVEQIEVEPTMSDDVKVTVVHQVKFITAQTLNTWAKKAIANINF